MTLFTPAMQSSATLSPCGKYRYWLERRWGEGRPCTFIMLNPSTADAERDDPTIRRCIGFAKREGCPALVVVNLFAFRATDPRELQKCLDPEGASNKGHLMRAILNGRLLLAAWGANAAVLDRGDSFARMVRRMGRQLMCLGVTKEGHPRHPVRLAANTPLIPYTPPAVEPRR